MFDWLFSARCTSKARLEGKTAVVTGCNTGIGRHTVGDFYRRGCRVIMACRDVAKAEATATEIRQETQGVEGVGVIVVVCLDLSSFASIRQCVDHLLKTEPHIDLLINNAGVFACPKKSSKDGFELQFATNHLGHFLLTLLLLPRILKSTPARIVFVTSSLHSMGTMDFDDINYDKPNAYGPTKSYNRSKLANILCSNELAKRLEGTGVTTYCANPGAVKTDVGRHVNEAYSRVTKWMFETVRFLFYKKPDVGAQTTIYCAVDESIASETGQYYSDCKKGSAASKARDPVVALRLWEESLKWVGLENYDPFTAEDTQPSAHTTDNTSKPAVALNKAMPTITDN